MSRWRKDIKDIQPNSVIMRTWLKTEKGQEYKKRHNEYVKKWRKKNKKRFNATQKRCYDRIRVEVLTHYSKGAPKCKCCKESGVVFLSIDHIDGKGFKHRKQIDPKGQMGGNGLVYWIKKNNYPKGFQVLCYNCNFAKRNNKQCPHKTGRTNVPIKHN